MALPNSNISTSLVKSTLGASTNDVGQLCTHPNINKWSKWKPVRFNKIVGLTVEDLTALNFGLNISVYKSIGTITTAGTFLYDLKNAITNWSYLRPRGGDYNEWYRLGDFRNYNHEAVQPMGALSTYVVYLNTEGGIRIDLEEASPNNYNVTLQDFVYDGTPMNSCYLGVMLYKENNTYMLATSENTISSGGLTIPLKKMTAYIGTWKAAFFLSSVKIEAGGDLSAGFLIPIDMPHSDVTINVNSEGTLYIISPLGVWNQNNNGVNYELIVSNNSSFSKTIIDIQSFILYTTGSQLPSEGTIISQQNHGSLTVPGKSSSTISSLSFTHTKVEGRIYWLAGKASGVATNYMQIEESIVLDK